MTGTNLEKAFFVDMLANGVPVKNEINVIELFEDVMDISINTMDADMIIEGESLYVLDKFGQKITRASLDHDQSGQRILFYSSDADAAMEHAATIGQTLFILVTCCVSRNWLNLEEPPDRSIQAKSIASSSKNTFEFNSEFI
jgi:hypothetical protein